MPSQPKHIKGVPTSTTGSIGLCHKSPIKRSARVTSLADFERTYGIGRWLWIDGDTFCPDYTWHGVRASFMAIRQPAWAQADILKHRR